MKISFVIPAYNEEAYLPICLDAVMREKNTGKYDMEIIVVNNASTDATRAVALSYPGVKVVDEMKKGLTPARQAGFLAATGDLIANIDSDSVLTPGWLQTVMQRFEKNPRLVALSGPFIYHDFSLYDNFLVRAQYNIDYIFYFFNRFVFRTSSLLQGGNFVIRKTALDKIGGFDTKFSAFWGEDTHIAKQLNPLGPVVFTFKLPIYSSGRRLKKDGIVKMGTIYAWNFLWTILFDKPLSHAYTDIRLPKSEHRSFRTTLAGFNKMLTYVRVTAVFVVFSLMGGSAFMYNYMINALVPTTAQASVISLPDHPILSSVHNSIVKLKEKVKILEGTLNNDGN